MDDAAIRRLRRGTAALAAVVAGIHLLHPTHGFPRLLVHLSIGTFLDPRPLAFSLSGLAIVAGILLVYNGVARRQVYLGGMVLVGTYLLGYVAWHLLLGHGAFWPYIEHTGSHEESAVAVMFDHLAVDPWALVAKITELGLLVALAVLYRDDR